MEKLYITAILYDTLQFMKKKKYFLFNDAKMLHISTWQVNKKLFVSKYSKYYEKYFICFPVMPKRFISAEERERRRLYQRAYRVRKNEDANWVAGERKRTRVSNKCNNL